MGEFTDVLKELGSVDAADLQALEGFATKYPALDNAVLRAKELSRQQGAWGKEKATLEAKKNELQAKVSEWDKWLADGNWIPDPDDPNGGMSRGEKAAREQLAQVTTRLAEMEAGTIRTGGPMEQSDFAAVKEYLAKEGFAFKADLAGFAPKADVDALKTVHGNALGGFEVIYRKATPKMMVFAREFPEDDPETFLNGFVDYLTADPTRTQDVNKAFEEFIGPQRAAAALKKQADELAAKQAEFDKKVAEHQAAVTGAPSPTDTGSGSPEIGHFQNRVMNPKKEDSQVVEAPLGTGVSAMVAAEKYRKGELVAPKETVQ